MGKYDISVQHLPSDQVISVLKHPLRKLWLNTCDACHMAATHFTICCVQQQRQRGRKGGYKRSAAVQYCALSAKNCADLQQTCLGYVMDEPGL